ncbi:hypothetical protein [Robertmurraya sp. Marseille-Q9965]
MKTIIHSLIVSVLFHIIFFGGMLVVGYVKTRNYEPDLANRWERVEILQNEVAFGTVGSPLIFIFTFIGITLISFLILFFYQKLLAK